MKTTDDETLWISSFDQIRNWFTAKKNKSNKYDSTVTAHTQRSGVQGAKNALKGSRRVHFSEDATEELAIPTVIKDVQRQAPVPTGGNIRPYHQSAFEDPSEDGLEYIAHTAAPDAVSEQQISNDFGFADLSGPKSPDMRPESADVFPVSADMGSIPCSGESFGENMARQAPRHLVRSQLVVT